ncbi:hypothetical protein G7Y89_g9653 [Cudoniella acicularis]|uniref:Rhodopsin domain-containing protein n=1 Tax=Cudoniella acicularis TaxID=354080 RepID=A0A8H4RFS6_9HELO|nr:hypothetical protein G7Y89_g9653 [Cudoniella acicularis]
MAAENRGPQVEAVAILFLTLSWVFVSLRCYVRSVIMKSFGADDWLAAAALVLFSLYCTFVLLGVRYGTGQHLDNLPKEDIPIAVKWWWCCELAYVSSTTVIKASIGIFLMRICVKRMQIIAIWVTMGVVILFSVFYFFLIVFQCRPSTYFWTQYKGASGSCVDPSVITSSTYAHSTISAVADWTLGILPIFLVWDLAMNPRTKVSVGLILGLGAIGSTATIVRIPYIKQLSQGDFLYSTTDVAIWSTVEPGIGITASAMATLRPLFRTFFARSKLFGSTPVQSSNTTPWPASKRPARGRYFRSGSSAVDAVAEEELGLRSDIGKGVGITTVINSTNVNELDGKGKRGKGGKEEY